MTQGRERRLSLGFGNRIGVLGVRLVVGGEGFPGFGALAVHLDRADKDEAPDACRGRLPCKMERGIDIRSPELRQRIRGRLPHDMHPGGQVNDGIDALEIRRPVQFGTIGGNADRPRGLAATDASHGKTALAHLLQKIRSDETRCTGDERHSHRRASSASEAGGNLVCLGYVFSDHPE